MIAPCQCKQAGFCPRYQKEMRGRWWEICHGINVDLGTAAAFRAQWDMEAKAKRAETTGAAKPLLLRTAQAPGDALAMTAAIYSLHRAQPGKYLTAVESPYPEIFAHNPDVVPARPDMQPLQMHYPAIHQCNDRGIHFMQGWCEFLGAVLGISLSLLTNRPRLYFDSPDPPQENFWLVCSGGKRDFTAKLWGQHHYQQVIDALRGSITFVQVGRAADDHPRLSGTLDMVGKTTLRELFALARQARGILCGISLLMHVAAALEKPAIVIAGGREPVQWNAYPKQHYLHTVGALPCRSVQGHIGMACWRSRTLPLGDSTYLDRETCQRPVDGLPECMTKIKPAAVIDLIKRYDMV